MLINGKEVDFRKSMPMTLGDLRKLAAKNVDVNALSAQLEDPDTPLPNVQMLCDMLLHFAQKSNPAITMEDLDEVPITEMQGMAEQIFSANDAEGNPQPGAIDPNS